MPSASERHRNNLKAGIFVTIAIVLLVMSIVLLTDTITKLTRPTRSYTVEFEVKDGVKNLKKGADIRIGGVSLGSVAEVTPRFKDPADEKYDRYKIVDVEIEIDDHVRLYEGARIVINSAILGADAWIEIDNVGDGEAYPDGATIDGISTPGIMASLVGSENASKTDEILDNVRKVTVDAKNLVGRIESRDWPRWSDKIDAILDWGNQAMETFSGATDQAKALMTDGRAVIADNRPQLDSIVDNVDVASADLREVTAHVRTDTLAKIDKFIGRGQEGLETVVGVIDRISKDYDSWAPDIREALVSFRLAAQTVQLATMEVRRSPWKLFYTPSPSEYAHEKLYDATRAFALATADMRAAAETAQRLLDTYRDQINDDPKLQRLVVDILQRPTKDYDEAQQRLLNVLRNGE